MTDTTKNLILANKTDPDFDILKFLHCTFGIYVNKIVVKSVHYITINNVDIDNLEAEDISDEGLRLVFNNDLPEKLEENSNILLCEWQELDKSIMIKYKKTKNVAKPSETFKIIDESITKFAEDLNCNPKLALNSLMSLICTWYCGG